MINRNKLKIEIIEYAKELGFNLIGFTRAKVDSQAIQYFNQWLKKEYAGEMEYMQKEAPREDLNFLLEGAQTVISLAINYYHEQPALSKDAGRVARYAYGRDYHKIIAKKLKRLREFIQSKIDNANIKGYVDTGPVLERALAEQAGLGVIGKNSCLITEEYGSWVFLAEIITTLDLVDETTTTPAPFSKCGPCTLCMKMCPTQAIVAPGVIDARRCLSYLTIENKEEIPEEFKKKIKETKRIYGCDICQEVCPQNKKSQKQTATKEFLEPKIAGDELGFAQILNIKDEEQFLQKFAGSPCMRAKRKGIIRNVRACLDN